MWTFSLLAALRSPVFSLRPYQNTVISQVEYLHSIGTRKVAICAPTASGKGTMMAALARNALMHGQKVVVFLTMLPLVQQTIADCEDLGIPAENISVISGSHDNSLVCSDCPIQIVMLQTFNQRSHIQQFLSTADIAIFDEAHTSLFYEAAEPVIRFWNCTIAAFSATYYNPDRNLGINEKYGGFDRANAVVFAPDYYSLQRMGFLAPLRYNAHSMILGRNQRRDLHSDDGIRFVVQSFFQSEGVRAEGCDRALWFCAPKVRGRESQSERLQRIARDEFGLNLVIVNEDVDKDSCEEAIEDLKRRRIDGLISVWRLSTGVDIRCTRHVNLLAPILEPNKFVQTAGRASRISPETGKRYGYINCWAGNIAIDDLEGRHPTIEELSRRIHGRQDLILNGRQKKEGEALTRECPCCQTIVHASLPDCPHCGMAFPRSQKEIVTLDKGRMTPVIDWGEVRRNPHYAREQYERVLAAVRIRNTWGGEQIDEGAIAVKFGIA